MKNLKGYFLSILNFYLEGFRGMSWWGRRVWLIIVIKLFIMFAILKIFFFPDILKEKFSDDRERSDYVIEQLTNTPSGHD
ncbi:MAG: DUF4492 domain-containing protein [Bacteroidales bacterium]|nr:DUF4492 domain-containing protein [Bacteroidales bacterium]